MKEYSAQELFELLNEQDESTWIEAKGGCESTRTVMETVCAYSNEPDLGGGYIIMGFAEDNSTLFPQYKTVNIADTDKFQKDFATQCASMFNFPVRPELYIEKVKGDTVIKIWVNELPAQQKPLYFKADGLPSGAYRRIGSTDQRCTEDDMHVFYRETNSFDQSPVQGVSMADIDENALKRYRILREKVNPYAEELTYSDEELLQALGCTNVNHKEQPNLAGLLLFGTSMALRRTFPMLRVDYIRVPGNTWVQNADDRFTTIDMRGSLLTLLYRLIDAINADLPKGFLLETDEIQATTTGLPLKALREAIVNALMHRSYREHRPTQVIRYDNRIEIINPGFSLKAEEKLGEPGSETRNPFIAAVFHETNLAETKGSGIRAMRRLMNASHLGPPTFESRRNSNEFVARLLLHHFLNEDDLIWLKQFEFLDLNDSQKQALVFIREVGAIDNHTYRQMADCDVIKASSDLRALKTAGLFDSKGKGKATYYLPTKNLINGSTQVNAVSTQADVVSTQAKESEPYVVTSTAGNVSTDIQFDDNTIDRTLSTPAKTLSTPALDLNTHPIEKISQELRDEINQLGKRINDNKKLRDIIGKICTNQYFKSTEIAEILSKREDYIKRKFLSDMIKKEELVYLHPEMINHPEQAYKTKN